MPVTPIPKSRGPRVSSTLQTNNESETPSGSATESSDAGSNTTSSLLGPDESKPLKDIRVNANRKYACVRMIRGRKIVVPSVGGKVLREVKKLQRSTRLLIPKTSFSRLVKEISQNYGEFRFQADAVEALHEACEHFLVTYLSDSYLLAKHRQRQTLEPKDMHTLRILLLDLLPGLRQH